MLARNSSRSRNGHRSSIGLETSEPSGRCIDDNRGHVLPDGGAVTSHTTGPSRSSTARTVARRASCPLIASADTP